MMQPGPNSYSSDSTQIEQVSVCYDRYSKSSQSGTQKSKKKKVWKDTLNNIIQLQCI